MSPNLIYNPEWVYNLEPLAKMKSTDLVDLISKLKDGSFRILFAVSPITATNPNHRVVAYRMSEPVPFPEEIQRGIEAHEASQ